MATEPLPPDTARPPAGRHRAGPPSFRHRPRARTVAAFTCFAAAAALTNLAVLIHPAVPVGFGWHASPAAFVVAVIDTPLGWLQPRGGRRLVLAAVLTATLVSTAVAGPFGLAWGIAYLVGELVGECTWRPLDRLGAHPVIVTAGALLELVAGVGVYVWLLFGLAPVTLPGQLLGTVWGLLALAAPVVVRDTVRGVRNRLPDRARRTSPADTRPAAAPVEPPRRRRVLAAAAIAVFAAAVAAANALTARYGFIPVGLGLTATAGTYAAGFCLLARDWVHDTAGRVAVLAAIAAAGAASAVMAGPRLAVASATAFVVSELADLAVYQPLRRRGFIRAVIASNTVGAPVDTVLFLALAGFPIWAAVPGQLLAKATATAIPVAVVLAVRALLRHRVRAPGT